MCVKTWTCGPRIDNETPRSGHVAEAVADEGAGAAGSGTAMQEEEGGSQPTSGTEQRGEGGKSDFMFREPLFLSFVP